MLSIFQNLVRLLKTDVGELFQGQTSESGADTPAVRPLSSQPPATQTNLARLFQENMATPAVGSQFPDESSVESVSASPENISAAQPSDSSPTDPTHPDSASPENRAGSAGVNPLVSLSLEKKGDTFVRVAIQPQPKIDPQDASLPSQAQESTAADTSQVVEIKPSPNPVLDVNEKDKAVQEIMDIPAVGSESPVSSPETKYQMNTSAPVKQYAPNSPEAQKAIAMRYYDEILNDANLATIDELMSNDFIFTIPTHPDPYRGPEGFKNLIRMLHGAFPDVHMKVEHLLVDGYTVVGHWTGSGTHTGGALHTIQGDIPATGKRFVIDGMTWLKIVDGKIVESRGNEDTLSLLRQLGVLPPAREVIKATIRSYFEDAINRGKLERLSDIVAPDLVMHAPLMMEPVGGLDGLKNYVTILRTGFPDIRYNVEREMADKDMGAIRWMMTGTHQGEFLGVPPSSKSVNLQGVTIFRLREGQIVEIWINEHALGLMEQISGI